MTVNIDSDIPTGLQLARDFLIGWVIFKITMMVAVNAAERRVRAEESRFGPEYGKFV